jgi:hypothetical protein
VQGAFTLIEGVTADVRQHCDSWTAYSILWLEEPSRLGSRLGEDLGSWIATINDMRRARSRLESSAQVEMFGPVAVEQGSVVAAVSLKVTVIQ